ncbi:MULTISPECIES: HAAS signaling domain-containing protein [unclassified Nocardioides]|uniref:HAAS signaling domain-containing protein n=1 Tax=unclassified Nocardioides TaxID=2615069 RepID=UPI00360CF6EC
MSVSAAPSAPSGSSLTERYLHAVTRRLPEDQRADVAEELRATIADRIDTLAAQRSDADHAANERLALQELGDPDRLAAGYTGRRLQLIGPDLYPAYERLLKPVLVIAVPAVTILVAVIDALSGESLGDIVGGAVGLAVSLVVQVAFWVTLVFAIVERTADGAANLPSSLGVASTVDQLPDLPSRRGSLSDLIASLVWLGLIGLAIVWQEVQSPLDGGVPLLDPDLWSFWLPLILVLLVAEAVFEVVKYRIGRWTPALATVNAVLGAVFAAPIAYLAATDKLLNPAAVAEIQDGWAGFDPDTVNTVVVVVALAIWLWDAVDGFRRVER